MVRLKRMFESSAICSSKYAQRFNELNGLEDQDLFDALKPGDILYGIWGYNRTITDYFIVKRKTAKRVFVHKIEKTSGNQQGDSWGGWTVCPVLPPIEKANDPDIQGIVKYGSVRIADYPKRLSPWKGNYGDENSD